MTAQSPILAASQGRKTPHAFLAFALVGMLILLILIVVHFSTLPDRLSQHETIVLGQTRLAPGSQAAMRVLVRDSKDAAPLAGAEVEVVLRPPDGGKALVLFSGQTGVNGAADVTFDVPQDFAENGTLVVETHSNLGSDTVERSVTLSRQVRLLLTTDKPLYQPGQVIHIRLLALSTFDLRPAASQSIEVTVADGKGNKVFRKSLVTTDYGVAAVDFQLASQVNTGAYKLTATLGDTTSEKTVTVENYILPKFAVELETERSYYQPGQRVQGSLKVDYFFGKPVAGGQVFLEGYTFDVERSVAFTLYGTTDENGNYTFAFDLPSYIAGSDLEGGLGRFYLQAEVTDLAEHRETSNLSLPVAQNALILEAMPEGGRIRPGVENIFYILASYPDGSPAAASLTLQFSDGTPSAQLDTGEYGLAEFHFTPSSPYLDLTLYGQDAHGNFGQRELSFEGTVGEETILLRPDAPVYQVGDSMQLTILATAARGSVYLDIVREGQTVSTRVVELDGGQAQLAVDLTPDLYGTLELHAYRVLRSGSIVRDTRLVVVDNATGLDLRLQPQCPLESQTGAQGECTFRPGETASLLIQVNGADGQGAQSALGLAVVDESVFALAEQDPGFARLYFLLEQEILTPRYDLHGFSFPDLVASPDPQSRLAEEPGLRLAVEGAAQASLAAAVSGIDPFSLQANSHEDAIRRAEDQAQDAFAVMSKMLFPLYLLGAIGLLVLSGLLLWRSRRAGRALALLLGLIVLLVLAIFLWPTPSWVSSPLDRLGWMLEGFLYGGEWLLLGLVLLGLAGLITLVVLAVQRRDADLGWSLGLLFAWLVVSGVMLYTMLVSNSEPGELGLLTGVIAFFLPGLAFLLRSAGYAATRRPLLALAGLGLSLFLIIGFLPAAALSFSGMGGFAAQAGVVEERVVMNQAIPPSAVQDVHLGPEKTESGAGQPDQAASAQQPPRLRQYFPETMLWLPDLVTDESGSLLLDMPLADSITTWRMTALASTQDGRLGSAVAGLRVFQDFFIDLDLPLALTVGDEIAVPVGVFNYLPEPQTVRLELEQQPWFELYDDPVKTLEIAANEITVVYFRVKATAFGSQPFKVTAYGSSMSDAIQKEVRVYPDGKNITFTASSQFPAATETGGPRVAREVVRLPAEAIPGTQTLLVKVYPGIFSQVVEGLDSILRMPYGCFEQTSSTTYPNVLVLDYLKTTSQAAPELQLKAEEYINLGYQRLATFEVGGSGGFSLFGDPPPDRMLTAYGLQEFSDMSRVSEVDPEMIRRAAEWLFSQQAGDGSWENDRGLVHEGTWSSLGDDRLPVTAYIAWSLVEAGYANDSRAQNGLAYVKENISKIDDAYVAALVANALVAADLQAGGGLTSPTLAALDRLAALAVQADGAAYWQSGVATFMGGEGQTGSIETTALAALALLRSNTHPELGNAALAYLVRQKDSFGTWYSTQATVLSLKALLESVRAGSENVNAQVTITLNGGQARTLAITPENYDVVQLVSFEDINPGQENMVELSMQGDGNLMYQVTGSYYLPWSDLAKYPDIAPEQELVTIDVHYDRTSLAVDDMLNVQVSVTLNQPGGKAESALIDLGLPPGFELQAEDLAALVRRDDGLGPDYPGARIERYELTGRQVLVYIQNLDGDLPLTFSYRLKARFPLTAQTPPSSAYDYYNPQVTGDAQPQLLVVTP